MIPPSFVDLGRKARDLFSKGYNFGFYKLDARTKTNAGVELSVGVSSNHENGLVFGNLETKYKLTEYGVTLSEKWTTANVLNSSVAIDNLIGGLKLALGMIFSPDSGKKSGLLTTEYICDGFHTNIDADFASSRPTITSSAVVGYDSWLVGYQVAFDSAKSQMTRSSVAIGYATDEYTLHTSINDSVEFNGSVFHNVSKEVQFGVLFSWLAGSNATRLSIGSQYSPTESNAIYRAQVNNASQVGLSYQQQMREGVSLTVSTLIEGKMLNQGGHKVGLGLEFE